MKKFTIIVLITLCFCLTSCVERQENKQGYRMEPTEDIINIGFVLSY